MKGKIEKRQCLMATNFKRTLSREFSLEIEFKPGTPVEKNSNYISLLENKIKKDDMILAIDIYQKRFKEKKGIKFLTSGTNTLLKFIQRFNIYEVPSVFKIKKTDRSGVYKQDSAVEKIGE